MKRSYDERSMKKLKQSWDCNYARLKKSFTYLQTLAEDYSCWIRIQQDADELYQAVMMTEHESPQDVINNEIALYRLMEQEVFLRKKLKNHQQPVTRIEGRPSQERDNQYGKLISIKLRLLELL